MIRLTTILFIMLPLVVLLTVLKVNGTEVGPVVVVSIHGYMLLVIFPLFPHSAVMQFPSPSDVLYMLAP